MIVMTAVSMLTGALIGLHELMQRKSGASGTADGTGTEEDAGTGTDTGTGMTEDAGKAYGTE